MASRKSSTPYSVTSTSRVETSISYLGDASTPSRPATGRLGTQRTGTEAGTSTGDASEQQIICALTESRGVSPTVGLAFVNLSTTEAVLCQIFDNQTYIKTLHKLHVFDPSEILIPTTHLTPVKSKLVQVLEATLEIDTTINPIGRKFWDETAGLEHIDNLSFKEDIEALKIAIGGNFYATCCLAAILGHVESTLRINFAFHSMRIRYEASEGSMMMDFSTINSLELIQNIHNVHSKDCLYGLLNHTLTPMGARLLRCNILQPLVEKHILEKRYDAVEEFTVHAEVFFAVRQALKSFVDIDRVLTNIVIIPEKQSISYWEQSVNNVILVKQYIKSIPAVFEALHSAKSEILRGVRDACHPDVIKDVQDLIDAAINEDVTYQKKPLDLRNQRTYAVKVGVNGLLDVARQMYKEANQDAFKLIEVLKEAHSLSLECKFDTARQIYIALPVSELQGRDLPDVFINVYRRKNMIECQTLDIVKLNQKITDSHNEVLQMSESVIRNLTEDIRDNIGPLFKASDSIALLDILASLAQIATIQDYCRPNFSSALGIKDGRHPMREKIQAEKYIANDIFANSMSRLQIITGCNMSGKSTYIRSIALMTIMAQLGSFVPASYATFPIRHQLFARVSLDDSSTSSYSTFSAEMRETAFILRNIDSRSLVIVDELGRGTSTRDGLAIAIAIAEALVQSKALVWFATHFRDLSLILSERPGVVSMHLAADTQNPDCMKMLYCIESGPVKETQYGIALAKAAALPSQVIDVAEYVSAVLAKRKEVKRRTSKGVVQARKRKLLLKLREQLVQAKEGDMKGEVLRMWLKRLQDAFVMRMSELEDLEMRIGLEKDTEMEESSEANIEDHSTAGSTELGDSGMMADVEAKCDIATDLASLAKHERREPGSCQNVHEQSIAISLPQQDYPQEQPHRYHQSQPPHSTHSEYDSQQSSHPEQDTARECNLTETTHGRAFPGFHRESRHSRAMVYSPSVPDSELARNPMFQMHGAL